MAQRRPELAALFDLSLLMIEDPMRCRAPPTSSGSAGQRRMGGLQQVFHEFSAVFDECRRSYLRERKGDASRLVGRCG